MTVENIKTSLLAALEHGETRTTPYRHWLLSDILPGDAVEQLLDLPFSPQSVGDVSGKRELHNASRTYFDAQNNARYPVCNAISEAFQDPQAVGALARTFDVDLTGANLRIEFAADTDGFWLEPHTDLGVKRLTFLYYLSDEDGQENLGTDLYASKDEHSGRPPFISNSALVFVPSDDTWHGFEPRPIKGVRKSLIVNYVTSEWRARDQLAYPETPVVPA